MLASVLMSVPGPRGKKGFQSCAGMACNGSGKARFLGGGFEFGLAKSVLRKPGEGDDGVCNAGFKEEPESFEAGERYAKSCSDFEGVSGGVASPNECDATMPDPLPTFRLPSIGLRNGVCLSSLPGEQESGFRRAGVESIS